MFEIEFQNQILDEGKLRNDLFSFYVQGNIVTTCRDTEILGNFIKSIIIY